MEKDYWADVVYKLKNPVGADRAAHLLSLNLGRGVDPANTNLGEALRHLPRDELLAGVVQAYQNPSAQPYCDQILWYFEPEEVLRVYEQTGTGSQAIRAGVKRFLQEVESPLVSKI